jgi:eukaryotic-like serine/threonine-protein kinase
MATPAPWEQVKRILAASLELKPEARPSYLDSACEGDADLRREIESLLAAHDDAGDFIENSALADDLPGERVGHYRVIRELGQGGMGRVYLAERADEQFQQRVAIKLIKRGMDSDSVLRQFRNERQILAGLQHPNISRLLDGGLTAEGRPYLVMEFIEGEPIDEYCVDRKLGTRERLELFQQVCAAVQYAHQRLIVHRDIKPSNILVSADGIPRLLDFGIARILTPDRIERTATVERRLTPEYASPEHVRGEPITTSSDVYSLGILLYQLLTGERPYHVEGVSYRDLAVAICETQVPAPSTRVSQSVLRRQLEGDLDNIVLMALRKEPDRRYASVEQFSEDIRRHLNGLPVIARKDTIRYRAVKFTSRHRIAVAAALLAGLSLIAGAAAAVWQASLAGTERNRAERRFNEVRRLANSLLFGVYDRIDQLPGSLPARELIVRDALRYLDGLAGEASGDPTLTREIAAGYRRLGTLQGRSGSSNLGDAAGAIRSFHKARELLESALKTGSANDQLQAELAATYDAIAAMNAEAGTLKLAEEFQQKSVSMWEAVAASNPASVDYARGLAASYVGLARRLRDKRDLTGAEKYYRLYLDISVKVSQSNPADERLRYNLGLAYNMVADILHEQNRNNDALIEARKALAISEPLVKGNPNNTQAHILVSFDYQRIAELLAASGNLAEAESNFNAALKIREKVAAANPKDQQASGSLARIYLSLGQFLWSSGRRGEGIAYLGKALAVREANAALNPSNPAALEALTDYTSTLARKKVEIKQYRDASALYDRAIERLKSAPPEVQARPAVTQSLERLIKEKAAATR